MIVFENGFSPIYRIKILKALHHFFAKPKIITLHSIVGSTINNPLRWVYTRIRIHNVYTTRISCLFIINRLIVTSIAVSTSVFPLLVEPLCDAIHRAQSNENTATIHDPTRSILISFVKNIILSFESNYFNSSSTVADESSTHSAIHARHRG